MPVEFYCVVFRQRAPERIEILKPPTVTIGRDSHSTIWLADSSVSRLHACLRIEAGRILLVDSGSRNGTIVNSERVKTTVELNDGSEIQIGPYSLLICDAIGKALGHLGDTTCTTNRPSRKSRKRGSQLNLDRLTPSQQKVFEGFVDGLSEKEVATRLKISVHTVHTHAKAIYKSLEVSSRGELLKKTDDDISESIDTGP